MPITPNIDIITDSETFVKIGPITVGTRTAELARLVTRSRTRKDASLEILDEQVEILWGQSAQALQDQLSAEKARLADESAKIDAKLADLEDVKVAAGAEVLSG